MSDRADRLVGLLTSDDLDLLLITALVNVRYMTGYTGTNGLALVGPQTRVFVTDFRYVEQAKVEVQSSYERRRDQLELFGAIAGSIPASGELRLGFDDTNITVRQHARLREVLPERVQLVPAGGLVEQLRAVKEPDEIDRIRRAATAADYGLAQVLEQGLLGRTERELADALEQAMRDSGADRPGFELIIAAGPHGALPHAKPRDVEVKPGDMVVIDWGAEVDGYRSDCTRTIAAGEPSDEAREIYELVLEAERAGLGAVRSGAGGREVDATARAVIQAGGQGDHFGHGLGHGVGIDIHEAPRLSMLSEDVLTSGNVVTVEPGIYLAGRFGVRIEDLVVVGEDGCDVLTSLDKGLTVAG
ncbi:MAG TPA: Xaa-Pro peptidase family protein [Solirubrobacteraceae bacterium]|nr:Xaa-Pro peptidase family protein [Solirubrobacteraceae bacterium]